MKDSKHQFQYSRQYSEKRNYVRIALEAPMQLILLNTNTNYSAICKSLSGNGLLFESSKAFTKDTQLEIQIKATNDKFEKLHALIEVIRNTTNLLNNQYQTAAKIIQVLS